MFSMNSNRPIKTFEPSANEYIMDVCFSPVRASVFAAIGSRGNPYIYDLTISDKKPAYILESNDEESKITRNSSGVKISFNPKQRDFLAVGYLDGKTKIYKLNHSLSNPKKNEIKVFKAFLEQT